LTAIFSPGFPAYAVKVALSVWGSGFGPLPSEVRLATDRRQIHRKFFGICEIASPATASGSYQVPDERRIWRIASPVLNGSLSRRTPKSQCESV
jgi:hypothetical protein